MTRDIITAALHHDDDAKAVVSTSHGTTSIGLTVRLWETDKGMGAKLTAKQARKIARDLLAHADELEEYQRMLKEAF